jgi:hypothetical protein
VIHPIASLAIFAARIPVEKGIWSLRTYSNYSKGGGRYFIFPLFFKIFNPQFSI